MVATTINGNLDVLYSFFQDTAATGEFVDLLSLNNLQPISDFINLLSSAQGSDPVPTALGSNLIALRFGTGVNSFSVQLHGSNFGPITGITPDMQLQTFFDAIANGTASAQITSLVLSNSLGPIMTLDMAATGWTITSGTDVITIAGNLPTSFADIWAATDEILLKDATGNFTGEINTNFDATTSVLNGYGITSITAASNGTTTASILFGTGTMTVNLGQFTMALTGNLPADFADLTEIGILFSNSANNWTPPSNYTITGLTITDNATGDVVLEQTGSRDFSNFFWAPDLLGSWGDDTIVSSFVGTAGQGMDINLYAGSDIVTLADNGGDDRVSITAGLSGDTQIYLGAGDQDTVTFELIAWNAYNSGYGMNSFYADIVGNDLVFRFSPSHSVTLVDQMIPGNVEMLNMNWSQVNLSHLAGSANADYADYSSHFSGVFYSALDGDDYIVGGWGADLLFGNDGNDIIEAGSSGDFIDGGAGSDVLYGGADDDTLDGGSTISTEIDVMYGGTGNDTYYVNSTSDYLDIVNESGAFAGSSFDRDTVISKGEFWWDYFNVAEVLTIDATAASGSVLISGTGNTTMHGNDTTNFLLAYGGSNTIKPGKGIDVIGLGLLGLPTSSNGANTVWLKPGDDVNYIYDFESGIDKIDVSAYTRFDSSAEMFTNVADTSWGSLIWMGPHEGQEEYVGIVGLFKADLDAADFIT